MEVASAPRSASEHVRRNGPRDRVRATGYEFQARRIGGGGGLDARDLAPPKPLRETLERAESLGGHDVLVQYNDRTPQSLFPRLDDRGYAYAAVGTDAPTAVVTAIWPGEGEWTVSDERAEEGDQTDARERSGEGDAT
ncbi:DUF2249 domain-containing protein [Halorubrum sp. SD690R]|uniref:DUF2249 domain-containing protein n=1 Tax=Halorubrum sp. SD690R TaxID=2518117 RepID=UPI0010F62AF8|nr:DUF2249 domain-containing protein [Halorubrum sp. SD690R]TKX47836.1 DUF2249 domain-containing protein [Halorubrum sp. SD690R]